MKISSKNISVSIGNTEIVKDINIKANQGSFIGIIGPNGSGKSTFLKSLYRVLRPSCGDFYLDDENLSLMPYKSSAKKMAVVTQHNYYNFDFTVFEVVLMGRAPHKKALEKDNQHDYKLVDEALEKVEMTNFKNRVFSSLSGGEQQRIMLARALAQDTKCLVLDEPTNHLDIKHQLKIMDLSKKLGVTVIAALHDLNIAATYCDYLYVLKEGSIFSQGSPKDVLTEELIERVYEVPTKIFKDKENKRIHIAYLSGD